MLKQVLRTAFTAALMLTAGAEDGVGPKEIVVGQCAALSGPAAGLGTGMNQGLAACLAHANVAGGVGGRLLRLVTVDDAYEPERCVAGTLKLIEVEHVFCLAGYVGTPTTKVALPILAERKVPLVGAFTGAGLLRLDEKTGHPHRYVINVRASYDNETEALVERMVTDLGASRIAVFYQNDSFGLAGLSGTQKALTKRGLTLAAKGTFERNTVAVKKGLADVIDGTPEAVVMVGPYKPIATFLKEAKAAGLQARFATISFVGTENLIAEGAADAENVIISQVVPSPADVSVPLVKEYREALKEKFPEAKAGYVSLEGYATGKVLLTALARCTGEPTREGLIDACEALSGTDLGGLPLTFSPTDHQGSDRVFITCVQNGAAVPTEKLKK